jgi:hypothetical protein
MVVYSFDCNYITPLAMKSKSASEWLKAFGEIFQELTSHGFKPKLQTMHNEESSALKSYFTEDDMTYQLVPPRRHMRNAADRAIRTFKEHFVAGLASVDSYFPMHLWDHLLPQSEIKFNLPRTSRLHPQLSEAAHFHGQIDYNKTEFAPPGCNLIAHEKPSQSRTWAPHGQPCYSLGPTIHRYICQNVYITSTASERIVDALEFFPHNSPMQQLSSTDQLIMAANNMADALKHPHPDFPLNTVGKETRNALTTLAAIFKRIYNKSPTQHIIDTPIKTAENKRPAVLVQPVLTSPTKHSYQKRLQTQVNTIPANVSEYGDSSQLPRVVIPEKRIAAPPRVPARARNLSPRNLSQGDFWDMGSANNAIPLGDNHWT